MKKSCLLLIVILVSVNVRAQQYPLKENFDRVTVPVLPSGWKTSINRSAAGDFTTTTSSPRSQPNTLLSTNATISQTLATPIYNFRDLRPERLEFWISRSGTHTAALIIEASLDGGGTYPMAVSDTIQNNGLSGYQQYTLALPAALTDHPAVSIRWRIIGNPTGGTSGTFRMDDITITASAMNDLALLRLQAFPIVRNQGLTQPVTDGYSLEATIKNVGTIVAPQFALHFFLDRNNNRRADADEQFAEVSAGPLATADTAIISTRHPSLAPGEHCFIAVLQYTADGNPLNDSASIPIIAGADSGSIVMNEIMFDPQNGESEWIELYNRSNTAIEIAHWKIAETPQEDQSLSPLSVNSNRIDPGEYFLLAADSTILQAFPYLRNSDSTIHLSVRNRTSGLGLNNSGDELYLLDASNQIIDFVTYSPSWHHPDLSQTQGISLERISSDLHANQKNNWSSSASSLGGTPGKPNSILARTMPLTATIALHPNPFSPDRDGHEDHCLIRYSIPLATSLLRMRIYDREGRIIRRLSEASLSGSTGEMIWDGYDDEKRRVRIGPYIIFLEAIDSQGGTLASAKSVVVVAARF